MLGLRDAPRQVTKTAPDFGSGVPRDDWETPPELFQAYRRLYTFTLDAAANHRNKLCPTYFDREADGLAQSWRGRTVWLHPPHSDPGPWMVKAASEAQRHRITVVALVPVLTQTDWWHDVVMRYGDVRFLRGTPKFRLSRIPITDRAAFGPTTPFAVVVFKPGKTL